MIFIFLALFSTLVASVISSVLTHQLTPLISKFLFSNFTIPSFTESLAYEKTLDTVEFPLFLVFSLCIFITFAYLSKEKSGFPKAKILALSQLIFASIFYFQTFFVDHSGIQTLLIAGVVLVVFTLSWLLLTNEAPDWQKSLWGNGLLLGFYLLILGNLFLPTKIPSLSAFFLTPLFFIIFSKGGNSRLTHPSYFLLLFAAFFPFNKIALLLIGSLAFILIVGISPKKNLALLDCCPQLLTVSILFIIAYNPLFYFGTFDTIEEGFWLGWLQRLLNGEVIYRDFAAYHPPLLLWGLKLFTSFAGASIYSSRLYFHLLQVLGTIITYLTLSLLVKNSWIRIGIFLLILSYGSNLVRNNMEIRIAAGILPLTLVYLGNLKKSFHILLFGGFFSGLSLFVSLEIGIATFVSLMPFLITKTLSTKEKIYILTGFFTSIALVIISLAIQGALNNFIQYMLFYSKAFSEGYLNTSLQRPETLTLLQWYKVNQFISSSGFLWEIVKITLGISLFYIAVLLYKKRLTPIVTFFMSLVLFTLVLSRSALGRSDGYHIAFVWVPTLILLGFLLTKTFPLYRNFSLATILVLTLLIARDPIQTGLIQQQFIKLQTYGNPSGNYPSYTNPRSKILTGVEVNTKKMDEMLDYIQTETTPQDTLFVFPLAPEIYFLTGRKNTTQFDTPTAFFTESYQRQIVNQLKNKPPKIVIYNKDFSLSGLTANSLPLLNDYIQTNFSLGGQFGEYSVLKPI